MQGIYCGVYGSRCYWQALPKAAKAQEDALELNVVQEVLRASREDNSRAWIPRVVGQEGNWLLLTPLGARFTSFSFKLHHLQNSLKALHLVHGANIIH